MGLPKVSAPKLSMPKVALPPISPVVKSIQGGTNNFLEDIGINIPGQAPGSGMVVGSEMPNAANGFQPGGSVGVSPKAAYSSPAEVGAEEDRQILERLMERPQYQSMSDNGFAGPVLKDAYTVKWGDDVGYDPSGYLGGLDQRLANIGNVNVSNVGPGQNFGLAEGDVSKLRDRAFGTGASPWALAQMDQQRLEESTARDQMARGMNSQLAGSFNSLAAQGGLEGGSRERLFGLANRDAMEQRQRLSREGIGQRLGITSADEAQRLQLQTQLPGMALGLDQYQTGLSQADRDARFKADTFNVGTDLNKTGLWSGAQGDSLRTKLSNDQFNKQGRFGADSANVNTAIKDKFAGNAFDMDAWAEKMRAFSAGKVADAQGRSGSDKSWLEKLQSLFPGGD